MKKTFSILAFCFAVVLAACSAPPQDDGTGPIKLGFIGPLSGDAAPYGLDTLHGVEIAVNMINAEGGIAGRQVELIAEDGRCTGTDAASAAQKLVNVDRVVAIIGGQCSGETLAAAPIVETSSIPMISPLSSSPEVTTAGDYVFRLIPSDALAAKATANYLRANELTNIAILTENTDFATAFRDALINEMGEESAIFNETVEPNTKDFRTVLTRLQNEEFDVFVANGQTVAVIASMIEQLRELGLSQPTITNNAGDSSVLASDHAEVVEGLKVVSVPNKSQNADRFAAVESIFTESHGEPQQAMIFVALAHDSAAVLLNAIANVGTAGSAIRDYLYSMEAYAGASGNFWFNDDGDVLGQPFALKEFTNGAIEEVEFISLD